MLTDKEVHIKFTVSGQPDEITITQTGQQLEDIMRRRMKALMPSARITDISEVPPRAHQTDLVNETRKK